MKWQKTPSPDWTIMFSLLFHPCQEKLAYKCKYPQYIVQMEAASFGMAQLHHGLLSAPLGCKYIYLLQWAERATSIFLNLV